MKFPPSYPFVADEKNRTQFIIVADKHFNNANVLLVLVVLSNFSKDWTF